MKITKRRVTKRNRIKRKYSKKRTKTRHSRKRVFSKKRRKTIKKKKRGGGVLDFFRGKKPVEPVEPVEPVISVKGELIAERYRKKRQKESDLNSKKMKEEELKENLKEIEKLSIDKENIKDKIDKLMNDYETVDNIVNENIQTITDFKSDFVKENILNFIKENHDEIRTKLFYIRTMQRIKESGKNEGIGGSHPIGSHPPTHIQRYEKDAKKPVPYSPLHFNPQNKDEKNGNEPSSNNKNNYDVEQDKKDLNKYKKDYFKHYSKIKEIINPSNIEKEIENINNINENIKDNINKIDKKYNRKQYK